MKHRPFFLIALLALPLTVVAAQNPPTRPTPPTPPTPVTPLPPSTPVTPYVSGRGLDRIQLDEIRRSAEDARRAAEEVRENVRFSMQDFRVSVPFEFDNKFNFDFNNNFDFNFNNKFNQNFNYNFHSFGDVGPRPAWAQGDAADSLWRLARETINRTDYSKAASLFNEIVTKYPNSRYAPDAAYWEAFARYRVGTLEQLRLANKALDGVMTKVDYVSNKSDVPPLRARILSALATRGERGADEDLKKLYTQYPTMCDREQIQIKSQLLNSMYQSDPEGTMPTVRKWLDTRDACNADMRRTSVFLLANRPDEQKTAIIAAVAKNDTVGEVRRQAIDVLSRMPGDLAITTLQDLMRDPDEQVQSAAVRSLMRSDNPKTRTAMRTLIDRKESPERLRIEAIQSYDQQNTTADDATYLRTLYNRDQSDRVKEAIISALGRTGTQDNVNFLLNIAKNENESSSLRSTALNRISRMNLSVEDLSKLYDASDSRNMRRSLVNALGNRKEDAAVTKLLEIAKLSTDPEVQSTALQVLLRKNDPEINKKIAAIIKP